MRRKKGKYVYIICSKNPKHKQRYVYLVLDSGFGCANVYLGRDEEFVMVRGRYKRVGGMIEL